MNNLRLTPNEIDKHAFAIKRYRINNLRLTPIMAIFLALALALIFSQWARTMATDTTDMVLIPKGEFSMGSKDHSSHRFWNQPENNF